MDAIFKNWEFWAAALGVVVAFVEARWKVFTLWKRHLIETDPERMRAQGERDALIVHSLRTLTENQQALKTDLTELRGKHSDNATRSWQAIEQLNKDVSRIDALTSQLEGMKR